MMHNKAVQILLRIVGCVLISFAAILVAMDILRSIQVTEHSPPDAGFTLGFHIGILPTALAIAGGALLTISFLIMTRRA